MCITCAFVTSCVSVWVSVSMCIFMRKTFSCLQCCSSQGFTWYVLWKFPEINCICSTWTQHPLLCDHFVTLRFSLSICCFFIKLLKNITSVVTVFSPHYTFRLWRLSKSCARCKAWTLWWRSIDNIWASCWTGCLPLSAPGPVSLHRDSSCRP